MNRILLGSAIVFLIAMTSCQNETPTSAKENDVVYKKWLYKSGTGLNRIESIIDLRPDNTFDDTLREYVEGTLDEVEYGTGTFQISASNGIARNLILNRYEYSGIKPLQIPQAEIVQEIYQFAITGADSTYTKSKLVMMRNGEIVSELLEVLDY